MAKLEFNRCADIGKPVIEPLINAIKEGDNSIREAAEEALVLASVKDVKSVEALIAALEDESCNVKETVTRALDAKCDKRAIFPLVNAIKKGSTNEVIIDTLEKLGWQHQYVEDKHNFLVSRNRDVPPLDAF